MSVAKDALGTEQSISITAGSPSNYTGLTVVSNTNGAIVITIITPKSTDTITSVTGYTKITSATASDNTWHLELWGKVGNSTGAQTIAITPSSGATTGDSMIVSGISVTGASQAGGTTTFANANTNTGTGANTTISITTATTDLCLALAGLNNEANAMTQTKIYSDTGSTPSQFASYDQGPASSPVTFATTGGVTSVVWVTIGCDIAAPSTAAKGGTLPLMGVG